MSDAPGPPLLPQHALTWLVVAALVLVLVRDGADTTTSAPRTTGQGSRALRRTRTTHP